MTAIETFRSMLAVRRHRLDDELEVQAEVMDRISQQVSRLNSAQLEAYDKIKRVEARLFQEIKDDDPKMSVSAAEAEAKRHRDRIAAWETYQEARQEWEEWDGLLRAWVTRGYNLKTLADLYGMQYFAIDSAGSSRRPDVDRPPARQFKRDAPEERQPIQRRRMTT